MHVTLVPEPYFTILLSVQLPCSILLQRKLFQHKGMHVSQAVIAGAAEVSEMRHVTAWIFAGHSMVHGNYPCISGTKYAGLQPSSIMQAHQCTSW